ncbi:polysaccharide deacetylase family protein [Streptomyces yaizuensis]|uniref:Polysaccharide deacetylase family protein n=1 Tax=Streptomyces yaizuensis TaxID=2989713 RepID=A0ABQ5P4U9_9ACTN|nr:polysaccharide deacetylase family protein [Streptomyces sp. YSPA8]GLF97624.1 polysaccharide deacetylase family protein [Streptomyces sp. YSPA8]
MKRRRTRVAAASAALLAAVAAGACTAEPPAGPPGARGPGAEQSRTGAPGSPADRAEQARRSQTLRAAAAAKWGLERVPLAAPPPPAVKPALTTREGFEVAGHDRLPPVFTTVPVTERVVFLTIDDGREKDPDLLRMMTELGIPYSSFLSDYLISDDYAYFGEMRDRGVALHNHTLNHRYMPALDYAEQKREICGQQDRLARRYGTRPPLFRPPYGNYNQDTLRAARACGVKAVPLWAAEAFPDRMEWREWDRDLHPGDIILTHFRGADEWDGTMVDMIRQVMRTVTEKGYAVARLEDYV